MSINSARTRLIASRLRSRRLQDGPYSVFGKLKSEYIDAAAAVIAAVNHLDLTEDELTRAGNRYHAEHPEQFLTMSDAQAAHRQAVSDAQTHKVEVTSVTRGVLEDFSPVEKLHFARTGELPRWLSVKDGSQ
jgi:hypothetical protein